MQTSRVDLLRPRKDVLNKTNQTSCCHLLTQMVITVTPRSNIQSINGREEIHFYKCSNKNNHQLHDLKFNMNEYVNKMNKHTVCVCSVVWFIRSV